MTMPVVIQATVRFDRVRKGHKVLRIGEAVPPTDRGKIPRVARLLALAHHFETLIRDGQVRNYAELARLGHVTRARLSQILNLLNLAPDLQEAILGLTDVRPGEETISERQLRPVMAVLDWRKQRRLWARIVVRGVAQPR